MADGTTPGYSSDRQETVSKHKSSAYSGTRSSGDPTNEPGQYPDSLFGVTLPAGTGAPGTASGGGPSDPANEPGQVNEGISGLGPPDTTQTGSPGSTGAATQLGGGPDSVTITRPGSYLSGSYVQDTVSDSVSGPADWTQAGDQGYASGGPQLPALKGNEPSANDGPFTPKAGGHVMRGGRMAH